MSLRVADAEAILRKRLGRPSKLVKYVIGFTTPSGNVLAIERRARETRVWFQPPVPPEMDGVRLMNRPSNGNANLNGPLSPLRAPTTLRVQVDSHSAIERFLDWYLEVDGRAPGGLSGAVSRPSDFNAAFQRFQKLVTLKSGHPFRAFDEGLAAVWESYKPRLRGHALDLLGAGEWSEGDIGSGSILNQAIQAIEIQDSRLHLVNNLVFWQNRYGHGNRDHRTLLEATSTPKLCVEIEDLLFGLYCGDSDEGATFDRLSELTGKKYPLVAYLFFLKDMSRFMPIHPTGFDRAFSVLGIDFRTLRQCSWENYVTYNATLDGLRPLVAYATGLEDVHLIDAHSFCWIYTTLLKQEGLGKLEQEVGAEDAGPSLSARERSIIEMRNSVEFTVRNANGQIVERTVKNKELRMSQSELERLMRSLLDLQHNRCALTGIPFQFSGLNADTNLYPSLDRIDSSGHYAVGNVQIVCRFINFWKNDSDNEEFKRMLMLVRERETGE